MATRYVVRRVAEDDLSEAAATYYLGDPERRHKGLFQEQLEAVAVEMGSPDLSRSSENRASLTTEERVLTSAFEALRHVRQARQQRNVARMVETMASLASKLISLGIYIDPDARRGRKTGPQAAAKAHGPEALRKANRCNRAEEFDRLRATGMQSEAAAELTGNQFGVGPRQIFRDLKAARENS